MKKLIAITMVLSLVAGAGAALYSEDFAGQEGKGIWGDSSQGEKTDVTGITSWSVSGSGGIDADSTLNWWMVTNGVFEGQDIGDEYTWETSDIDVSGESGNVTVSMDFAQLDGGFNTGSEYFEVSYALDDSTFTSLLTIDEDNQSTYDGTSWTSDPISVDSASTFLVKNTMDQNGADDGWSFDNVEVIPEPTTFALFGLLGVGALLRRRLFRK